MSPTTSTSTGTPESRTWATNRSRWASEGWGAWSSVARPSGSVSRSTASSRRMSPSAAVLVCSIASSARRAVAGSASRVARAPRAWRTVTEMACETTSCSSRAIRDRSSATARAACSSCSRRSRSFSAFSSVSRSRRSLIASPAAHGPPTKPDGEGDAAERDLRDAHVVGRCVSDGERDHRAQDACHAQPCLDPARPPAERVVRDEEDDDECQRLLVEAGLTARPGRTSRQRRGGRRRRAGGDAVRAPARRPGRHRWPRATPLKAAASAASASARTAASAGRRTS